MNCFLLSDPGNLGWVKVMVTSSIEKKWISGGNNVLR